MSRKTTPARPASSFRSAVSVALLVSLITPAGLFGEEETVVRGSDVVLQDQGALHGIVVDEAGQPISSASVTIHHNTRLIATTTTGDTGRFAVRSLRNGTHVLQVNGSQKQVVRLWSETAAPPTATNGLVVTLQHDMLVRGQAASTPSLLTNPLFIAGVVGITIGTIAIVENENDDNRSASTNIPASP
jgi:hypothetical protein